MFPVALDPTATAPDALLWNLSRNFYKYTKSEINLTIYTFFNGIRKLSIPMSRSSVTESQTDEQVIGFRKLEPMTCPSVLVLHGFLCYLHTFWNNERLRLKQRTIQIEILFVIITPHFWNFETDELFIGYEHFLIFHLFFYLIRKCYNLFIFYIKILEIFLYFFKIR